MTQEKERIKIAVLASTSGSDLPALFSMDPKHYDYVFLITDRKNSGAREKAQAYGIPDIFLSAKGKDRQEYDTEILKFLRGEKIDLVVLVGWMRILSPEFVHVYENRIMNVHPSLLPKFAGGMDTNVHEAVLNAGEEETGATVHFVTEEADAGPIILQQSCEVLPTDTPETLKRKVQILEQEIYPQAIELFRTGKLQIEGERVRILS